MPNFRKIFSKLFMDRELIDVNTYFLANLFVCFWKLFTYSDFIIKYDKIFAVCQNFNKRNIVDWLF